MKKFILMFLVVVSSLCLKVSAQPLAGIKTIKSSGGNYLNFTSAISDLNINGVGTGGVTFKVDAGAVFNEANILLTASGTAANPIIFIKEGTASNPLIKGTGVNSSTSDYFIMIRGGDYITFDGIDLATDPVITDDLLKIEHGFYIVNASITDGAQNITIKNCKITLEKTSSNWHYGVRSNNLFTPSNPSGTNSNLTIDNVIVNKGRNGIYINGSSVYRNDNITVRNCTVGGVGADIMPVYNNGYGIYIAGASNINIYNNEIRNISSSNSFYGIDALSLNGNNNINNNLIHNIRSTYATGDFDLYGLYASPSPGTCEVFNNVIYDFDNLVANSTTVGYYHLEPILATFCNVYNNTVFLNSQNPNVNTVHYWLNANCVAKNNIAYDLSASGTNTERVLILTASANVLENNLLNIDENGINNYSFRVDQVTKKFKDGQKGTTIPSPGYYLNNFFGNPNFISLTNLTPQYPSPASDNGQPVSPVTHGINGTIRNSTTPDIGAYEGDFGLKLDVQSPLIRFQPIGLVSDDLVKLTATITDNTSVTNAKLWYRIKGSASSFSEVVGTKYGDIWNFEFTPSLPNTYEYFICAKDGLGNIISNGFITSGLDYSTTGLLVNNPASSQDFVYSFGYKQTNFSGNVTVGMSASDYPSLTGAGGLFEKINNSIISGDINVIITSDIIETGDNVLKQWIETGAGNYTLTIKPHNASLHTLITFTAGKSITLSGVDRVTIDGSFNNDNANHILFSNANSNPIKIISEGSNGCENITIEYCNLTAGTTSALTSSGTNHSNWLLDNIYIDKGAAGINIVNVINATVSNCIVGNANVNNSLTRYGLYFSGSSNVTCEKNTVLNSLTSDAYNPRGILFVNITGGICTRNKITGIKYTGTSQYGAQGIYMSGVSNFTVANNIISDVNGLGSSSTLDYWISGISLFSCNDLKIYYNTINLFGSGNATNSSYCTSLLYYYTTKAETSNNILSNTVQNTISTSTSCLIWTNQIDPSNLFRNNIYYIAGTGTNQKQIVNLNSNQQIYNTLRSWQSAELILSNGIDLGSGAGDPKFVSGSSNDVTLMTTSPARDSGIPISITDDYNGNPRSSSSPDIGAFEDNSHPLMVDLCAPLISFIPYNNSASTTPTFQATITDNTAVTAAKFWYRLKGSSSAFGSVSGVKQVDNVTWNFTIATPLITDTEYEYFICARDGAGNIITNGITNSNLDATSVGLSSTPGINPVFVRSFKVTGNSISTGTISGGPFYISSTKTAAVSVPYSITGTYSSNDFVAYLSDAYGSFASKLEIGRLSSNTSGDISAIIPGTVNSGNAYKVRVESTNPIITGTESSAFSIKYDNTNPTVLISSGTASPVFQPFTVSIAFSEIVSGFTQEDLNTTNASVSSFTGSGRNYSCIVTPLSSGNIIIQVPSGAAKDLSDNMNYASNVLSMTYFEPDAPKLNITPTTGIEFFNTATKNVTFTFDQNISGFDASDISVTNGTISNFFPDPSYPNKIFTLDVSPLTEGIVVVCVASNSVTNGSKGNTGSSLNIVYDNTSPGVVLTRESGTGDVASVFKVLIAFNEIVNGFDLTDISVTNGSAGNLIYFAAGVYSVDISPTSTGFVEISVPSGVVTDLSGNYSTASNTLAVNYVITSIKEPAESKIRAYPNPTTGLFKIEINDEKEYNVEIKNFEGKTIMIQRGEKLIIVNLAGNAPGVYFVILTTDKTRKTLPIILH